MAPTPAVGPASRCYPHAGDDPAQEYVADGVTEAPITALTRFRWFTVTGRNASPVHKLRLSSAGTAAELGGRHRVEGSVRKSGARVRVSAQLVEASGGACRWAEPYDVGDVALFQVQDRIAQQVAGAIEPELLKNSGHLAARRGGRSVSVWDLVAQGSWLFHHVTRPTHLKARELFRQASRFDPELAEAQLWLGRVNAGTTRRISSGTRCWRWPCCSTGGPRRRWSMRSPRSRCGRPGVPRCGSRPQQAPPWGATRPLPTGYGSGRR